MILGLFNLINPLWEFFIAPIALVFFGWWVRGRIADWYEMIAPQYPDNGPVNVRLLFPEEDSNIEIYDWQNDSDFWTKENDC